MNVEHKHLRKTETQEMIIVKAGSSLEWLHPPPPSPFDLHLLTVGLLLTLPLFQNGGFPVDFTP